MKSRVTILAIAAIGTAALALPAVASAETVHAEKAVGGESPGTFTGSVAVGSEIQTTDGTRYHTTLAGTVHAAFETTTTGWLEITFKGWTGPFGFPCNSTAPAEPSGTVKTTKLTFHLVRNAAETTVPYMVITPNHETKTFAHLSCAGIQRTWEGTGLLGTLTAPKCGESSTSATVRFEKSATPGHQKHTTVTGTPYTLSSSGSPMSINMVMTFNFAQSTKLNCT